jgi:hypothetical protein
MQHPKSASERRVWRKDQKPTRRANKRRASSGVDINAD